VEIHDERGLPAGATHGSLVNISQNGARLSVPCELPLSQNFRIKITLPELGMTFYVRGAVCWTRRDPASKEEWIVGCSLQPGIPEAILSRLVTGGIIERSGSVPAETLPQATLSIDGLTQVMASVQNVSRGGFCLQSRTPLLPGQKVRLQLPQVSDSSTAVEGVVQWSIAADGRCLIGCALQS
jgi:hypothetical protein